MARRQKRQKTDSPLGGLESRVQPQFMFLQATAALRVLCVPISASGHAREALAARGEWRGGGKLSADGAAKLGIEAMLLLASHRVRDRLPSRKTRIQHLIYEKLACLDPQLVQKALRPASGVAR